MTTVAFMLDRACEGAGHVHMDVTVNSGEVQHLTFMVDELRSPLTLGEGATIVLTLMKLHLLGMTRAQARASLQAGFVVTI